MSKLIKSAEGMKGVLCTTFGEDRMWFFRVYHPETQDFTDYFIDHYDMDITITDRDAYVWENDDGELYIDYSPETLGRPRENFE